jgi:hypothetical protein
MNMLRLSWGCALTHNLRHLTRTAICTTTKFLWHHCHIFYMLPFIQNFSLGGTFYFQQINSWKKFSGCFMLRTMWPQLLRHSSTSKIKLVNLYRFKLKLSWKFSCHNIQITNKTRFIFYYVFYYNFLTNIFRSLFGPSSGSNYCKNTRYNVVNCVVTP